MTTSGKTYIVEHLDPELGEWSALEYKSIAEESSSNGAQFCLTSLHPDIDLPQELQSTKGFQVDHRSVEEILATKKHRVCLLDPKAGLELSPSDNEHFDFFLFGGILGDDPPRDRTSELRQVGFQGRRLGPVQMTTDTAVRVTRLVIQERMSLDSIPFTDHPELKINEHESTVMPFRYIKDTKGQPVMPDGMFELIIKDAEKGFDDFL